MSKNSFILYQQHYESIKYLNNEQLGRLFRAIFEYQINGEIPKDDDILMAFMFIKNQIDVDTKKWEDEKQKRSEAGRLGGIKRAINQNQALSDKSKQCLGVLSNAKQTQANQGDNVNVNVNVNDNVINTIPTTSSSTSINIYEFIEQNFGRTLSPIEYEEVSKWGDNELTRYAIKQAILIGKYSIKYISRIIDNYQKNGIITIQQAQEEERRFNESKQEKGLTAREKRDLEFEKLFRKVEMEEKGK